MAIKYVLVKLVSRIKKLANDLAKRAEADKMRKLRSGTAKERRSVRKELSKSRMSDSTL